MKTIRIKQNIYGNYGVFIGTEKHLDFGQEIDAIGYLSDMLQIPDYKLSNKSDITLLQVNDWRVKLGLNPLKE